MATMRAAEGEHISAESHGRSLQEEAREAVLNAQADLRRLLTAENSLGELGAAEQAFLARLSRQFLVNVAAGAVVARLVESHSRSEKFLLAEASGFLPDEELVRRVRALASEAWGRAASPLLRAEMLAYLSMAGDERSYKELDSLLTQETLRGKPLPLDVALFEAMRRIGPGWRSHHGATLRAAV
jgi:hypothetical protein